MKKIIYTALLFTLLLTGCAGGSKKTFSKLSDFDGAKVASLTGSVFKQYIDPVVKDVSHNYLNTLADETAALKSGKADAIALDTPVAKLLVAQQSDFVIFPTPVFEGDTYGFAVTKDSDLGIKGNEALKKLKADGTITMLEDIWFSSDESKKVFTELTHKADFDGSAGTIKYGCDTAVVPMSYVGNNGKPLGFDLDVARRIAYELNMKIEFVPMSFDALLASLSSKKVDMVGGCMSITEERKKSVDFIGPYYEGGIVFVIKKDRLVEKNQ